jgi:hypothetical protein
MNETRSPRDQTVPGVHAQPACAFGTICCVCSASDMQQRPAAWTHDRISDGRCQTTSYWAMSANDILTTHSCPGVGCLSISCASHALFLCHAGFPRETTACINTIAKYIKSVDPWHLVCPSV